MDAEAAALAMAEAFLLEAADAERHRHSGAAMMRSDDMDVSAHGAGGAMGGDSMHLMDIPQQFTEAQFLGQDADLLHNLMSMPDDESRTQLLQFLTQQEQQHQMVETVRARPQRHHLTISKEGKSSRDFCCFLYCVLLVLISFFNYSLLAI
jgi:hypothetical protein